MSGMKASQLRPRNMECAKMGKKEKEKKREKEKMCCSHRCGFPLNINAFLKAEFLKVSSSRERRMPEMQMSSCPSQPLFWILHS